VRRTCVPERFNGAYFPSAHKRGHDAHRHACTHVRVLSRQLETGVNVLHLRELAHIRGGAAAILFGNYSISDSKCTRVSRAA